MAKNSTDHDEFSEVTITYLDDYYQRIVKPGQQFLIPNYFVNYWLKRLGPTFAWVVVALQQAGWRAALHHENCSISQAMIGEEIGVHRHTVAKELNTNPWCSWHVPTISYQKGITDAHGVYRPLPNVYEIYEPSPLVPEHLAGLYHYFQDKNGLAEIQGAIKVLMEIKPREVLTLIHEYAQASAQKIRQPLSIKQLIELATNFDFKALSAESRRELESHCSRLQLHLMDIGSTLCRQYFRQQWAPLLGPALAWLVLILRSRCFYNQETGELRDTYTWEKKELAALLGQSVQNLKHLLSHRYAPHFLKILDENKRKLTIRVSMIEEPLVAESAEQFWSRQRQAQVEPPALNRIAKKLTSPNGVIAKKLTSPGQRIAKKAPLPPEPIVKDSTSTPLTFDKDSTSPNFESLKVGPQPNRIAKSSPHESTLSDSVLIFDDENDLPKQALNWTTKQTLKDLLAAAGLSDPGLSHLCSRRPQLDLRKVKATLLYAEARRLGPGYIYRHLEAVDSITDELFLKFAALSEEHLAIFRQAASELRESGELTPEVREMLPPGLADLLADFVWEFAGIEAALTLAALRGRPETVNQAGPAEAPTVDELTALWGQILTQLQFQMTYSAFSAYLQKTCLLARDGPHFTIGVENSMAKAWLEMRLKPTIARTVTRFIDEEADQSPQPVELEFVISA
jgi:hypothetical protein